MEWFLCTVSSPLCTSGRRRSTPGSCCRACRACCTCPARRAGAATTRKYFELCLKIFRIEMSSHLEGGEAGAGLPGQLAAQLAGLGGAVPLGLGALAGLQPVRQADGAGALLHTQGYSDQEVQGCLLSSH